MNKLLHPFKAQLTFSLKVLRHLLSAVCHWPKYSATEIQVATISSNVFHITPNGFR